VDLIVSPTTIAFNTQAGSPKLGLTPGQIIDALVLQLVDATTARLLVGDTVIDVQTKVSLVQGSTVKLAVRGTGAETRLVILDATTAPAAGGDSARTAAVAARIPTPARTAAGGQGASPEVSTAANTDVSATIVESDVVPAAPQSSETSRPPVSNQSPAAALAAAVRVAAARQTGLAPIFAEAAALAAAPDLPTLPTPVRVALAQITALPARLIVPSAENLQQAVARSGIFFEARLAAGGAEAAAAGNQDVKALLLGLRQALTVWLGEERNALPASALPAGASPSIVPRNDAAATQQPHATAVTTDAQVPPPPYRGASTQGQPPAVATIAPEATALDIGAALFHHTDGALARQTLLQAASLPDAGGVSFLQHDAGGSHWTLEIPLPTPQGAAIAQFEISRDGHRAAPSERKAPVWRANFALNYEPIGPVHAQVSVAGTQASVRLWAERADTAQSLRMQMGELADALREAALDTGELVVRDGSPPRPVRPSAGQFVDRAT
jgi:hypothetical protein